jgi:uncharacterized repeat protein (TIGR01451 family)
VAENAHGRTFGEFLSFTTQTDGAGSVAPTVFTNSATSVKQTSATLQGTVNPNGTFSNAWFEIGTNASALNNVVGHTSVGNGTTFRAFSFNITNLEANTVYFFRVAAENQFGTSRGEILNFTTSDDPFSIPPTVFTNSPTSVKQTSAVLQGTVNPNGNYTNAWFEFGDDPFLGEIVGHHGIGGGTAIRPFSFQLSNLEPDTTYFYQAVAENSKGVSRGEIFSFTTPRDTSRKPPVAITHSPTKVRTTTATLNGTVNPNGLLTSAWFEIGTDPSPSEVVGHVSVSNGRSPRAFSFNVDKLEPDTVYYYRIAAENDEGVTSGEVFSFITEEGNDAGTGGGGSGTRAPDVSTQSAINIGQTSATFQGIVDPNGSATTAWFEYGTSQSLGNSIGQQSVGSGNSDINYSFSTSGLQTNTVYYFRAVAENSKGISRGSILSFTTGQGQSGSLPAVFTSSADSINQTSANLNGQVNPNGNFTTAWFEWGTSQSLGSAVGHRSVGSATGYLSYSFSLFGLSPNTTYYYRAVAQSSQGTVQGTIVSFTTGQGSSGSGNAPTVNTNSATFVSAQSALLNGSVNANGSLTSAWFEWGTTQSFGQQTTPQLMGSLNSSLDFAFALTSLSPNTTYYFRAVAQNTNGTRYGNTLSFRTSFFQTTPPPAPPSPPTVIIRTVEVIKTSAGKPLVTLTPAVDNTNPSGGDDLKYSVLYNNVGTIPVTGAVLTITLPAEVEYFGANREPDLRTGNELVFKLGDIGVNTQGVFSMNLKVRDSVKKGTAIIFKNALEYLDDVKARHSFYSVLVITTGDNNGGFLSFLAGLFNLPGWLSNLLLLLLLIIIIGYILYRMMRRNEEVEVVTSTTLPRGRFDPANRRPPSQE